MLEVEEVS